MRVSLIVAMARNRVIGRDNKLPWHLPGDLQWFRKWTLNHAVVMGRKTFESLGKPLPRRKNIILTRQTDYAAPDAVVTAGVEEAIAAAGSDKELFVIGGAECFKQFMARARRIYLTLIHAQVAGDVYFPEYDARDWRESFREAHKADERHAYDFDFIILERVNNA